MPPIHYTVPTRAALIAELTEQRERLERWVAARTPEELEQLVTPSEVEGGRMWRPQDDLAHAVGVEMYAQELAQRTLADVDELTGRYTQVGALDREATTEAIRKALDEAGDRAATEYRAEQIEQILERLGETRRATLTLLESMSDEQLNQLAPHTPFGQTTLREVFQEMTRRNRQHVDQLTEAPGQA